MMPVIKDEHGRSFRALRVSLLHHCNMGCVYCVTGHEKPSRDLNGQREATGECGGAGHLLEVVGRLHRLLGLSAIRLTGGEPLLYSGLDGLISGIVALGIPEIKMTTNGLLLEKMAGPLKEAGLQSVNVSLDAVDEAIFFKMSRRRSAVRVMRGIDAALAAGLHVKLNSVVMKGVNESQIFPLLDLAFEKNCRIRFLEMMAMGPMQDKAGAFLFSQSEILSLIGARDGVHFLGRKSSATSGYWRTGRGQEFGIIANESEPFCGDCDRLRLDSNGNIYGCLSSNQPVPLYAGEDDEVWRYKLKEALLQKQPVRFKGSSLSMLHIGG